MTFRPVFGEANLRPRAVPPVIRKKNYPVKKEVVPMGMNCPSSVKKAEDGFSATDFLAFTDGDFGIQWQVEVNT